MWKKTKALQVISHTNCQIGEQGHLGSSSPCWPIRWLQPHKWSQEKRAEEPSSELNPIAHGQVNGFSFKPQSFAAILGGLLCSNSQLIHFYFLFSSTDSFYLHTLKAQSCACTSFFKTHMLDPRTRCFNLCLLSHHSDGRDFSLKGGKLLYTDNKPHDLRKNKVGICLKSSEDNTLHWYCKS